MIHDLMFDVVFATPDGQETVVDGWNRAESMGYAYYAASFGGLSFFVQTHRDNLWFLKVVNNGTEPVTGFGCLPRSATMLMIMSTIFFSSPPQASSI